MTMRSARFSQADVTRALRAARKQGMSIKIEPDGSIVAIELSPQPTTPAKGEGKGVAPKKEWRL